LREQGNQKVMKILVIDDHVLIRQAMHGVIRKLQRGAVVLEAPSYECALPVIEKHSDTDLILLDLTLPDRDGFAALAELRERYPRIPVVVLSAVQDSANVMKALNLGAQGYIPKSASADVILNALRLVTSGGTYIPPQILTHGDMPGAAQQQRPAAPLHPSPSDVGLTDRQIEILALLMQGKNNKTICRTLGLAEPTVKNHVSAVLKALQVSSRTEAVVTVNNLGWTFPTVPRR
jgi:DNA-binding NarL/FixJ family response regulator